ncbi:MAG: zinc metalloprotease, partial [Flavobacteriaceae bacterium]|nr:zinc metalloprotease [Flavobacteriaceae bacterium]
MRKKLYFVLVSFFLVSVSLFAQQRNCATMEVLERKLQKDPGMAQRMAQIEAHTQNYIQNASNFSVNAEVLYVPIVVHVVWNSANPVENISDAQILSQVDVIYKDFRRLNEDADDTWSQAADMEIEYYLAQIDPDGNPTSGITRTETSVTAWGTDDSIKFSSSGGVDAWDPTRYFNFWVGNIGSGILGYATFPASAGDPDDGIVMSPQYFGSSDYEAAAGETFYLDTPYDKGRTTTHEMGHYFNLRHIWGDGGCGVDDFVADTPESDSSNFGCPIGSSSCGSVDMVQNYMDYTDDACMNLFTEGQKDRMRAVLEAGGPREVLNQAPFDYTMALATQELDICSPADAVFDFTYLTFDGFSDSTDFSTTGLPTGATAVFSPSSATADGT